MWPLYVVADASTLSAVHSDVNYAAPDSGYTWSETDTPEITGMSNSLPGMTLWCILPPFTAAGYCTSCLYTLCCMCKHSMHACVSDTVTPSVSMWCVSQVFTSHLPAIWKTAVCVEKTSLGQAYSLCMCEKHCEVIILHKAVVFTGLDWLGRELYATNHSHGNMLCLVRFIMGILMGFTTSSSSLGSQAWYLRIWALVL